MATKAASPDTVIAHWCTLIENLQASPLAFYQSVEGALERREIPATTNSRVDYRESGVLSARREYLHVTRERLVVDICGAPFGTGFFVSWWLTLPRPSLHPLLQLVVFLAMFAALAAPLQIYGPVRGAVVVLLALPIIIWLVQSMAKEGVISDNFIIALPLIGRVYERVFRPRTYYRIDTTLMFQQAVHNAVLEVIDEMMTAKGLRALGESERKPIMREFYQRKAA